MKAPRWDPGRALTPNDVARFFNVDTKTVARWARDGKLACFWTPGGHRRYRESDVRELYERRQRELHAQSESAPAA